MTREPRVTEKSPAFRASRNTLIFNNLDNLEKTHRPAVIACKERFAQAHCARHSKQQLANVKHRPASRPGAD